jgi:hypothetical protein
MHGRVGMLRRCYPKIQSVYTRPWNECKVHCFVHCSDYVADYGCVWTAESVLICSGSKHVAGSITPCSSHSFKNGTATQTRQIGATMLAVDLSSQKLYTTARFNPGQP